MNCQQHGFPESLNGIVFYLQRAFHLLNQDQYLDHLEAATENSTRVKLIYEFMKRYFLFPLYEKINKSKTVSNDFRKEGNTLYVQNKIKESLELFNKAIVFAPKGSQELAYGYGNRSAALYKLNLYEQCLVDIARARKEGYDETANTKLIIRETSSERKRIKNLPTPDNARAFLFSLLTKRNTEYPCASEDLQISFDPKYGRGIIVTRDISPGNILVIEEPYSALIEDGHRFISCYGCCSLSCTMIPCECCTFAMFCNEECRSRTWDQYHKYECPLMDILTDWKLNSTEKLALRTVLKARYDHKSWDDLFATIKKAELKKDSLPRGSIETNSAGSSQQIYDTKQYTSIHMLETNFTKEHILELVHKCTVAATMIDKLKKFTDIFSKNPESNMKNNTDVSLMYSVGGLILHQLMISKTNAQNIEMKRLNTESRANPNKLLSDTFAMGMYGFLSLMNHSCNPNVELLSVNTTKVALVVSPIMKGEQVFKSYGLNYWSTAYEKRQKKLEKRYNFKCECEACVNRWPIFSKLQEGIHPSKNRFENFEVDLLRMFDDEHKEDTFKRLRYLCKDIKRAYKSDPNQVVIRLKLLLVGVWDTFGNHVASREN